MINQKLFMHSAWTNFYCTWVKIYYYYIIYQNINDKLKFQGIANNYLIFVNIFIFIFILLTIIYFSINNSLIPVFAKPFMFISFHQLYYMYNKLINHHTILYELFEFIILLIKFLFPKPMLLHINTFNKAQGTW